MTFYTFTRNEKDIPTVRRRSNARIDYVAKGQALSGEWKALFGLSVFGERHQAATPDEQAEL
jgi:hypothetical protein